MPQRVLLIGAYANGNIGDMYQADAIAGELLRIDPKYRDAAQLLQSLQPAPGTNALPPTAAERRTASRTPMA